MRNRVILNLTLLLGVAQPTAAQRQALDSLLQGAMASGAAPGLSVAVFRGKDTLLLAGYGFADIAARVPATPQTIYRIGSITKEFTAAAILRLRDQDVLRLEDSLGKLLPDYSGPGSRVTVRQLLAHTSGIPSYTSLRALDPRTPATSARVRATFEGLPLEFEPGSRWSYNNSGYFLLGLIVERHGGRAYRDFIHTSFAKPLALHHTAYCPDTPTSPRHSRGYDREPGGFDEVASTSMSIPFAAGALCSSVADLVTWHRALVRGNAISSGSYAEMSTPIALSDGRRPWRGSRAPPWRGAPRSA